jgi:hypothetical protein
MIDLRLQPAVLQAVSLPLASDTQIDRIAQIILPILQRIQENGWNRL